MPGRSHKPIVWGLFAGGGTVAAFLAPVMILVTSLFALAVDSVLSYETMMAFATNWLFKIILFGVIGLQLWHAAHRLRITAHDFGVRADTVVSVVVYTLAGLLTLLTAIFLLMV